MRMEWPRATEVGRRSVASPVSDDFELGLEVDLPVMVIVCTLCGRVCKDADERVLPLEQGQEKSIEGRRKHVFTKKMEKIIEMSHEMNHERNATALMLMEIIIHFAPKARDPPEKGRHVYITSMAR